MLVRVLLAILLMAPLALAQDPPPPPPPPEPAPAETAAPPEEAKPEEAKEEPKAEPQAEPQAAPTAAPAPAEPLEPAEKEGFWRRLWPRNDEPPAPAETAAGTAAAATEAVPPPPPPPVPRRLAVVQERLRATRVAHDPKGKQFLDLVDTGTATASQLNDFGIWLAGQGILEPAEEYFRASLDLDPAQSEVWNNLGMAQLRLDDDGSKGSFEQAIKLEPTHAIAHYNLGIFLDRKGEYDDAIEQYTRALMLDPRLGDPVHNPQVVNNQRLLVVKLGLYERKARTVGLPMATTGKK